MQRCRVDSLAGSTLRLVCLLYLLNTVSTAGDIAPQITKGPKPDDVHLNCKVVPCRPYLECEATGSPEPTYEWYKDGRRLPVTDQVYWFEQTDEEHVCNSVQNGEYQCLARNRLGVALSNVTNVTFPCIENSVSESVEAVMDSAGNVAIPCQGVRCEPLASCHYDWQTPQYFDDQIITNDGTLVIRDARASARLGPFTCSAENSLLLFTEDGPQVTISRKGQGDDLLYQSSTPQVVQAGRNLDLECIFTNGVTVTWFHNDLPVTSTEPWLLELRSVTSADAGEYKCEGAWANNSRFVKFQVIVKERLQIIEAPISQSVSMGSDVTFRCEGHDPDGVTTEWFMDDQPLQDTINSVRTWSLGDLNTTLTLHKVTLNQDGAINCKLSSQKWGQKLFVGATLTVSNVTTTTSTTMPTTQSSSTTTTTTVPPTTTETTIQQSTKTSTTNTPSTTSTTSTTAYTKTVSNTTSSTGTKLPTKQSEVPSRPSTIRVNMTNPGALYDTDNTGVNYTTGTATIRTSTSTGMTDKSNTSTYTDRSTSDLESEPDKSVADMTLTTDGLKSEFVTKSAVKISTTTDRRESESTTDTDISVAKTSTKTAGFKSDVATTANVTKPGVTNPTYNKPKYTSAPASHFSESASTKHTAKTTVHSSVHTNSSVPYLTAMTTGKHAPISQTTRASEKTGSADVPSVDVTWPMQITILMSASLSLVMLLLVVGLIALLIYCCATKRKRKRKKENKENEVKKNLFDGNRQAPDGAGDGPPEREDIRLSMISEVSDGGYDST